MANFILDTEKKVKDKLDMLQSISDIQIATKLLEESKQSENIFDDHYKKLKCEIITLDKSVKIFLLFDYISNEEFRVRNYSRIHSEDPCCNSFLL
jgi:poly [ADP-ribose] polymerase